MVRLFCAYASGEGALELGDEPRPHGLGQRRQPTLLGFVFAPAFGGLDRDGLQADGGEVIRAGTHVDRPGDVREFERIGGELGRDPWLGFHRPLEEIHRDVHAAGLLVLDPCLERGREFVQRPGAGREETESIIVRATHGQRTDHGVGAFRTKAERPSRVTALCGLPIDHGPLVKTEAAMESGARRDGPAEPQAEVETSGLRRVRQGHTRHAIRTAKEAASVDKLVGIGQRDAGTWRPTTQCGQAERIIGEEEILDGIRHALPRALAAGVDEPVGARLMGGATGPPRFALEYDLTGGDDAQSKRR